MIKRWALLIMCWQSLLLVEKVWPQQGHARRRDMIRDTPKCRREGPPMDDAKRFELLTGAHDLMEPHWRGSRAKNAFGD